MSRIYLTGILVVLLGFTGCQEKNPTDQDTIKEKNYEIVSSPENKSLFYNQDFLIDYQHSYIGFRIKYFGHSPVRGRFNHFIGRAFYDSTSMFISTTLIIDVKSINTGYERRDNDLKAEGWFALDQFPSIVFTSKKVLKNSTGFILNGDLTIRGVTKEVDINFDLPTKMSRDWAGNIQVDYHGGLVLKRSDFGVKGGGFWNTIMEDGLMQLSDEVEIELDIHTRKPDYVFRKKDGLLDSMAVVLYNKLNNSGFEATVSSIDSLMKKNYLKPFILSDLGNLLVAERKYSDGLKIFQKEIEYFPEQSEVMNSLGTTYLLLNDTTSARKYFENMLKTDSVNVKAMQYLKLLEIR